MTISYPSSLTIIIDGQSKLFRIQTGSWQDDNIVFLFQDEHYNNSGKITLNGKTRQISINTDKPYNKDLTDPHLQRDYFAKILKNFTHFYFYGWSPPADQIIVYDSDYHKTWNYTEGDPKEQNIKCVQAEIIKRLATPEKILIAGCSNGELVRQCRLQNIDASGFDVIPNIGEIAFPEVKNFIQEGSLGAIPFQKADGFDTLVAIDVLEHIPERDISQMVQEWLRLDIKKLVLLINLNEWDYPGHITLRPLTWWGKQWEKYFVRVETPSQFPDLPTVYSNDGLYNHQWTVWERITSV